MHCIGGNLFVIMDKKNSRSIEGLNPAITIYLNKRIYVIAMCIRVSLQRSLEFI